MVIGQSANPPMDKSIFKEPNQTILSWRQGPCLAYHQISNTKTASTDPAVEQALKIVL